MTTNAAVSSAAFSNAASTARLIFAASSGDGSGSFGRTSPIGHGWVAGSGSLLFTCVGVKFTVVWPRGKVTQPWLPRYFAVSVTPFGIAMLTVFAVRSIIGLPTLARSEYGLVK